MLIFLVSFRCCASINCACSVVYSTNSRYSLQQYSWSGGRVCCCSRVGQGCTAWPQNSQVPPNMPWMRPCSSVSASSSGARSDGSLTSISFFSDSLLYCKTHNSPTVWNPKSSLISIMGQYIFCTIYWHACLNSKFNFHLICNLFI